MSSLAGHEVRAATPKINEDQANVPALVVEVQGL